ncbi:hypothetical protein K488DRAFT_72962 [Vararia minispora EC-137]|uniref:Uncharacterized protein n=1 Tax=Vararia minispora EC-137 TaxID=1314806 RepID=A0ACB8QCT9_9AGAM|nr:hypothetical protein K488DRAFT_72962 [Vararia minispora EC-137]
MNSGRRQDTLNDHYGDWNWKKTMKIGVQLQADIQEAREQYERKRNQFHQLTASFTPEQITRWDELPRDFKHLGGRSSKEFYSVYRHKTERVPSLTGVYQAMFAKELEREQRSSERLALNPMGDAGFLYEGIRIQDAQRKCKSAAKRAEGHITADKKELERRRTKLASRIGSWRELQQHIMPGVADKLMCPSSGCDEDEVLWLPSDLTEGDRVKLGLVALAKAEQDLREGECFDAISAIRSSVKAIDAMAVRKRKDLRGTGAQTRSTTKISHFQDIRDGHMERYNHARQALVALGYISPDDRDSPFPPLTVEDTYRKGVETGREIGDSKRDETLLWAGAGVGSLPSTSRSQSLQQMSGKRHDTGDPEATSIAGKGKRSDRGSSDKAHNGRRGTLGWIWDARSCKKLTEDEMEAWIEEGDRVQWHRTEASMRRWQEQFERLQADFLRTVETFHKSDIIWSTVAQESEGKPGHAAYAKRKAGLTKITDLSERTPV